MILIYLSPNFKSSDRFRNGASDGNRTHVSALARPRTSRCTTPALFAGTIRENILLGDQNATEAQIKKAIKMACLDDFIKTLDNGLDTQIGERGILLSGGQKQRIAIARAFLKNAPILILDEATSALDNKSEAVVQKAIENLMRDKTVFVIAHRLSTIRNATKIVVINHGEIVESGSHDELVKMECGAYKMLYDMQFKVAE